MLGEDTDTAPLPEHRKDSELMYEMSKQYLSYVTTSQLRNLLNLMQIRKRTVSSIMLNIPTFRNS